MAYDKLSIVNDCLIATGNDPVVVPDGSPEWIVGSNAYDRALPLILGSHNWPFQTAIVQLTRIGASTYPGYCDIFEKPATCLWLDNVWRTDFAAFVLPLSQFAIDGSGAQPPELDYQVIGDHVHTVAPNGVTAKIVLMPPADSPNAWPQGFVEALRRTIESFIYQGLNEDLESALTVGKVADLRLAQARVLSDQESPRRVAFRSRMLERRRSRQLGAWW